MDICNICNQTKYLILDHKTKEVLCSKCYKVSKDRYSNVSTHERCSGCKEIKPVHVRDESGKPICPNCHHKARYHDPSTYEKCSGCGEVKHVNARNEFGEPICSNCYHQRRVKMTAHPHPA